MLNNVLGVMRNHRNQRLANKQVYDDSIKEVDANYIGNVRGNMIHELDSLYENATQEFNADAKKIVKEEFKGIYDKLGAMVTQGLPDGFMDDIQMIKLLGKSITSTEIEMMQGKYKGNYNASRCIDNVLRENGVVLNERFININDCINDIKNIESKCNKAIDFHDGKLSSYKAQVLTSDNGEIAISNARLNSFLDGNYYASSTTLKGGE